MKFYVYHPFSIGLVYQLTHNTQNRIIDEKAERVTCSYNDIEMEFNFNNFTETEHGAYHIIFREEMVKSPFGMIPEAREFQADLGFPECVKHEYKSLLDGLKWDLNWILMWNHGENHFIHVRRDNMERSKEIQMLDKLAEKSIFFTDNHIHSKHGVPVNEKNFNHIFTNDIFMWNNLVQIRWANEFYQIFKYLNPPYKLCMSFRSPKPHRVKIVEEMTNQNRDDVFVSFSTAIFEAYRGGYDHSWSEINFDDLLEKIRTIPNLNVNDVGFDVKRDFENLYIVGNTEKNYMEFDYYFRILSKGMVQLLDETHAYIDRDDVPMNLSEKAYIFLLANIPFISTHHYPFDIIKEYVCDEPYPYYEEMKQVSNKPEELVKFINHFLDNFDEMYPKIKEWTNKVHLEFMRRMDSENSFLEHMTTKINH